MYEFIDFVIAIMFWPLWLIYYYPLWAIGLPFAIGTIFGIYGLISDLIYGPDPSIYDEL